MAVTVKKPASTKKAPALKLEKSKKSKSGQSNPENDIGEAMSDLDEKQQERNVGLEREADEIGSCNEVNEENEPKRVSKEKPAQQKSGERKMTLEQRDNRSVFMKGLLPKLNEADLVEFFASTGKVIKARFIRSKNAVIVLFDKEETAQKVVALGSTLLKGKEVIIERQRPSNSSKEKKKIRDGKKKENMRKAEVKTGTGKSGRDSSAKKQTKTAMNQPNLKKNAKGKVGKISQSAKVTLKQQAGKKNMLNAKKAKAKATKI